MVFYEEIDPHLEKVNVFLELVACRKITEDRVTLKWHTRLIVLKFRRIASQGNSPSRVKGFLRLTTLIPPIPPPHNERQIYILTLPNPRHQMRVSTTTMK